jgi:hypothetical protein
MKQDRADISVKGKVVSVPAVEAQGYTIVFLGRWLRTAMIKGETWLAGDVPADPDSLVAELARCRPRPDLLAFTQKLPDVRPKFAYPMEWDNVAAIPLLTYADWWENRATQVTRKNVRRAAKRGTFVTGMDFNDELLRGIVDINNEVPIRDGRPFWHYGKDLETVRRDYSAYLDRSLFLGATFGDELIGFIRIVDLGEIASVMQLLCKNAHFDKRPANALLAKAVESCVERGFKFLVYGRYVYGDNTQSPLTEFKRRNGFERYDVPAYFVPLTFKGRLAIRFRVHTGLRRWAPRPLIRWARGLRRSYLDRKRRPGQAPETERDGEE